VRKHQLEKTVEFPGWMSQEAVAGEMRSADVFVFPSIQELGAGVAVEAIASGYVPVVVDYGGPAGLVDAGSGVKLAPGGKNALVPALAVELEALARDAPWRDALAPGAPRARSNSSHGPRRPSRPPQDRLSLGRGPAPRSSRLLGVDSSSVRSKRLCYDRSGLPKGGVSLAVQT
jgi:hypothetical protein